MFIKVKFAENSDDWWQRLVGVVAAAAAVVAVVAADELPAKRRKREMWVRPLLQCRQQVGANGWVAFWWHRHVRRLHTNVPRTVWRVVGFSERWHNEVMLMANAGVCRNSTSRGLEVLCNGWVDLRVYIFSSVKLFVPLPSRPFPSSSRCMRVWGYNPQKNFFVNKVPIM